MTPNRPYLVRAIFEWICDNDCTPYLLVDATREAVIVPPDSISEGRIVLNVSPNAVRNLDIGNSTLSFNARFGGRDMALSVPVDAVLAIYAKETQQGMSFGASEATDQPEKPDEPEPQPPAGGHLKVVK